jgi:hypothetical protein
LGKSWERWDHEVEPSSSFHSHQLKKDSKTIVLIFYIQLHSLAA